MVDEERDEMVDGQVRVIKGRLQTTHTYFKNVQEALFGTVHQVAQANGTLDAFGNRLYN
jgi:hypothetical protein